MKTDQSRSDLRDVERRRGLWSAAGMGNVLDEEKKQQMLGDVPRADGLALVRIPRVDGDGRTEPESDGGHDSTS